jgi:hypothetical protein
VSNTLSALYIRTHPATNSVLVGLNMQAAAVIPPQFDQYGYTMWIPTQAELSAAVIGSSLIPLKAHIGTAFQKISSAVSYTLGSSMGSGVSKSDHHVSQDRVGPLRKDTYTKMKGNENSRISVTTDIELASANRS